MISKSLNYENLLEISYLLFNKVRHRDRAENEIGDYSQLAKFSLSGKTPFYALGTMIAQSFKGRIDYYQFGMSVDHPVEYDGLLYYVYFNNNPSQWMINTFVRKAAMEKIYSQPVSATKKFFLQTLARNLRSLRSLSELDLKGLRFRDVPDDFYPDLDDVLEKLTYLGIDAGHISNYPNAIFSHLKCLALSGNTSDINKVMLTAERFPQLETLEFDSKEIVFKQIANPSFTSTTLPTIKHIKMVLINCFDAEFIKDLLTFMAHFPLVETIQLKMDFKGVNPLVHVTTRTAAVKALERADFKASIEVDYFVLYDYSTLLDFQKLEYYHIYEKKNLILFNCWMPGRTIKEKLHFCHGQKYLIRGVEFTRHTKCWQCF